MSRKVGICDVCDERYPSYRFERRAKHFIYTPFGRITKKYDVCEKCWENY